MAEIPAAAPARPRGISRLTMFAYLLVAPVVLLIVGLVGYPFVFAIWISFTDQVIGNVGKWIGFANFQYLAKNSTFSASIWNTITIVLWSDALKLIIGLGLALLVHQNLPARGIFRSFLMLPLSLIHI